MDQAVAAAAANTPSTAPARAAPPAAADSVSAGARGLAFARTRARRWPRTPGGGRGRPAPGACVGEAGGPECSGGRHDRAGAPSDHPLGESVYLPLLGELHELAYLGAPSVAEAKAGMGSPVISQKNLLPECHTRAPSML
ncbi:hypothetical protein GCM10010215_74500 [Streptomyces virginiae]|uniref:Uncharacterized protein n=1 Tax=Streptomyces virginiae TaxID=1961 RepID=A0ABQ3NXN2_STRVG|nr:hypothetical protein GCM10010215_74500 [Streptomyces virginiae]GHI17530.1 hypothetical protein Scinn_69930 [Streptomyces virginiae]